MAHINQDRIRATYNKAQWMNKRIQMMQEWADYLDGVANWIVHLNSIQSALTDER